MATLRDVKRKINSIRSTQTITRTMRMISASKLRRAQDELEKVTAYALASEGLLSRLASRIPEGAHPLIGGREEVKKVLLFPIASDRGLSGAFNLNVATAVERFVLEERSHYEKIGVYLVGRKIRDYLRRRKIGTEKEWLDLKTAGADIAGKMAEDLTDLYLKGEYDRVYLIYTHFHSAIKQEVRFEEFLPLKAEKTGDERGLSLRAGHGDDTRPLHPPLRAHEDLLRPRRVADIGARVAHGGDGERDQQLRRDDRPSHARLQQDAPAEHHQRDDGYRGRRRGAAEQLKEAA